MNNPTPMAVASFSGEWLPNSTKAVTLSEKLGDVDAVMAVNRFAIAVPPVAGRATKCVILWRDQSWYLVAVQCL